MYTILVGGLEHGSDFAIYCFFFIFYFPYIGNFIIPTDFHIFQRRRYTWRVLAPRRVLDIASTSAASSRRATRA